jgi:hypothetical protein
VVQVEEPVRSSMSVIRGTIGGVWRTFAVCRTAAATLGLRGCDVTLCNDRRWWSSKLPRGRQKGRVSVGLVPRNVRRPTSLRIVLTSDELARSVAGCGHGRNIGDAGRGGKRTGGRGMDRLLCKSSRLRGSRDRHGSTSHCLPVSRRLRNGPRGLCPSGENVCRLGRMEPRSQRALM